MATRTKPQPLILASTDQADDALRQLAEVARELALIEQGMNEQIDALKAAAKLQLEPLTASRKRLEDALAVFGTLKKAELFTDRKRSLELTFGVIGYRKATSLRLLAKHTWAMVLKRLQDLGLAEGVRTKQEVDKDALRTWPDERLETVGVKRETVDEFFVELKQEEIASKAA
jgi:phage host-nuclease inhibitor protein Gam